MYAKPYEQGSLFHWARLPSVIVRTNRAVLAGSQSTQISRLETRNAGSGCVRYKSLVWKRTWLSGCCSRGPRRVGGCKSITAGHSWAFGACRRGHGRRQLLPRLLRFPRKTCAEIKVLDHWPLLQHLFQIHLLQPTAYLTPESPQISHAPNAQERNELSDEPIGDSCSDVEEDRRMLVERTPLNGMNLSYTHEKQIIHRKFVTLVLNV